MGPLTGLAKRTSPQDTPIAQGKRCVLDLNQNNELYEFGWVVGLLEGEGCFFVRRDKKRGQVAAGVSLAMCDEEPVRRIRAFFGCGTVRGPFFNNPGGRRPNHRPLFKWAVGTAQARSVMRIVLPYMSPRRHARIEEVLAETTPKGRNGLKDSQ